MDIRKLIKIEPIAVKDKNDAVKALHLLERLGIEIMTDEKKDEYLADDARDIDNNYMIQEEDGFRIQSHFLGDGISLEALEVQIDNILSQYPTFPTTVRKIKELDNNIKGLIKSLPEICLVQMNNDVVNHSVVYEQPNI